MSSYSLRNKSNAGVRNVSIRENQVIVDRSPPRVEEDDEIVDTRNILRIPRDEENVKVGNWKIVDPNIRRMKDGSFIEA